MVTSHEQTMKHLNFFTDRGCWVPFQQTVLVEDLLCCDPISLHVVLVQYISYYLRRQVIQYTDVMFSSMYPIASFS